jgi:hypothetical protein
MATDQTPPRIKLILQVAIATPLILIGLKFVLDSYFIWMSEEASAEKMAPTTELTKLREGEQKALTSGPTPITAAMMEVSKGRAEQGGPELIQPQPSDDVAPLAGWAKAPRTFEVPVAVPVPAATDAGLPAEGGAPTDGGASTDGGKPRPTNPDAGRGH